MKIDTHNLRVDNVLGDGIGCVELIDSMGTQQDIINQARICYLSGERSTPESDLRLLRQLITARLIDGTPVRAMEFLFAVKLPLFVMRQWTRHLVGNEYEVLEFTRMGHHTFDWGGAYNEMSARYVDFRKHAEFYDPTNLRGLDAEKMAQWRGAQNAMFFQYELLRDSGIPKELARSFMPQSIYTQMRWKTNLQGITTWYEHRKRGSGAQLEHVRYAEAVLAIVEQLAPNAAMYIRERAGA